MLELALARRFAAGAVTSAALVASLVAACSSSTPQGPAGNADAGAGATCANPGAATPGAADTHCQGKPAQPVDTASCHPDAAASGDDGGAAEEGCPYGDTLYGQSGTDDDCKYKVAWTSTPICEGAAGVSFTVTITSNVDGKPVTGLPNGVTPEVFLTSPADASCDDQSTHLSPGTASLTETSPGSGVYRGPIEFDVPGAWTVRFHIHEECEDLLPTSQHGHIAFHVTVP
jgi:hypothetical protein